MEDEDALLAVRPIEKTLQERVVLGAPQTAIRLDGVDAVLGEAAHDLLDHPFAALRAGHGPLFYCGAFYARPPFFGGAVAFSTGRCPLPSGLRVRWRAAKTSVPAALGEARFLPGVEIAPTKASRPPLPELGFLLVKPRTVNNDLT